MLKYRCAIRIVKKHDHRHHRNPLFQPEGRRIVLNRTMTTDELLQLFTGEKAYRQLAAEIRPRPQRRTGFADRIVAVAGRGGSRAANREGCTFSSWKTGTRRATGNDLFPLLGEERLLFFPTGYKRSIQFGQEDPSGIV